MFLFKAPGDGSGIAHSVLFGKVQEQTLPSFLVLFTVFPLSPVHVLPLPLHAAVKGAV